MKEQLKRAGAFVIRHRHSLFNLLAFGIAFADALRAPGSTGRRSTKVNQCPTRTSSRRKKS